MLEKHSIWLRRLPLNQKRTVIYYLLTEDKKNWDNVIAEMIKDKNYYHECILCGAREDIEEAPQFKNSCVMICKNRLGREKICVNHYNDLKSKQNLHT